MNRKQTIFTIITVATILIIGGIVFQKLPANLWENPFGATTFEKKSEEAATGIIVKKDSDNDGLYDWEEVLWGSDPKNPDTDGDGTNDNEEVLQKRNPIIAGPDDFLESDSSSEDGALRGGGEDLTLTQTFTRDFIGTYLDLKLGDNFTPENQEKLIDAFLGETLATESLVAPLSTNDIQVLSDSADIFSSVSYIESFESAIESNFTYSYFGKEILLLKDILEGSDARSVEVFIQAQDAYTGFAETLKKTAVPKEISATHLALINSARIIAKNFSDIVNMNADPLNALIGVKTFAEETERFSALLTKIAVFGKDIERKLRAIQP